MTAGSHGDGSRSARGIVLGNLLLAVTPIVAGRLSLLSKHPLGGITPPWMSSAIGLDGPPYDGPEVLPGRLTGHVPGHSSPSVLKELPLSTTNAASVVLR